MIRFKSDTITDFAYYAALVIVLFLFVFMFPIMIDSDVTAAASRDEAVLILFDNAFSVLRAVFYSVFWFAVLLSAVVIVHELGHVIGGLLKGYRLAHFCVFGLVISPGGKKRLHFDRDALFGGYAVMCSPENTGSPLLLLRMGPWAECVFLVVTAVLIFFYGKNAGTAGSIAADIIGSDPEGACTAVTEGSVLSGFLLGEIIAFLLVRIASLGAGGQDDTSTAAQVICDGPGDYNRLMDIYDEQLRGVATRSLTPGKKGRDTRRVVNGEQKEGTRKRVLTIKEELSLYVKE